MAVVRRTGRSPTSGSERQERTPPARESSASRSAGRANGSPSLPEPRVVGVEAGTTATGEREISLEGYGGARLLVSDARVALLLLDRARYRVVARLFGVPKDQSWPVTLIALALVAGAADKKWDQMVRGPGGPTRSDVALGVATLRELLIPVAGPSSRDMPLVGTLVMIAVAGALVRPGLSRAVHGIRSSSHRARGAFNHRYGHLLPAARSRTSPPDTRSRATTDDI